MIRLHIDPHYLSLLEEHQLAQYAQLMKSSAGELLDADDRRDIQKIRLGNEDFFLKRTWSEKTSSAFESSLSGKKAHSKPFKEMLQISYLRAQGFDTAEVVAAGEELKLGIPVGGCIITREVSGEELTHRYARANSLERPVLLAQLGQLLARLHREGFFLSVRLKDIFVQENPERRPVFVLIDREARNPAPKQFSTRYAKNGLYTSARRQIRAGDSLSPLELRTVLRHYCDEISDVWSIRPSQLMHALRSLHKS